MLQRQKWKSIIPVLLVLLVFVVLNINIFSTWFRGDSEYYYNGICDSVANLKKGRISLANFGIAGHVSYGYSLFVFLGQLLIPYYGIGIRLVNLLLALVTIFVFWKVTGILFQELEQWTRVLITAAFAFSPFMLGISSEVHSDFPVLCFFTWLVYFYITKRQKLCLAAGFLLCFSKEIGVLYYASFFAGCFLYRLVKNENTNWLKKLGDEFSVLEWMLLVPADLFLVAASFAKGWANVAINPRLMAGKANSFVFSLPYIWVKFREIFVLNFAWLLIIPLGLFLVAVCRKKTQKISLNREWMTGIGVSTVVFLLFNFTFFTYTHYRYLQLFLFFYLVLVVFLLEKSCRKVWVKRGVSLLLAVAFLVESFVTADPVTKLAFRNIEVGNGKIITTEEIAVYPKDGEEEETEEESDVSVGELLDSIVYNREYLGFEYAFEEALADTRYDESKLLIFPTFYEQNVLYTLMAYMGVHNPKVFCWDAKTKNVTISERGIPIAICGLSEGIPKTVLAYEEVWYVKLCHQGKWFQESNLEYFDVLEERTYQSGKWKIVLEKVKYRG